MGKPTCLIVTETPSHWIFHKEMLEDFKGVIVDICRTIGEVDKYLNEKKYTFGIISNTMLQGAQDSFNAGVIEVAPLFETRNIPYVLLSTAMKLPDIEDKNLNNCIFNGLAVNQSPLELVDTLKSHKLL